MQNLVKIVLIEPQTGELDVTANAEVPFTFNVGDIRDISKKQGTFSKTIKLAGTKNNNKLLNNYFDVNIQAGTFNVNKLQKVQIIQNNVAILEDGYLQLLSINKIQNNSSVEELVEYDVVVKDAISDLFTKINNLELSDIELGHLDHVFSAEAIVSTLNNTYEDEYKYFIPNSESSIYNLNQFKPAVFAKTYLDYIINGAGFVYEWADFSGNTVQFDKLIIPYNGDALKADQSFIDEVKAVAEKTGTTEYSAITIINNYDIEHQDLSNLFDPTTGQYTNPFYIANGENITLQFELEYEVLVRNFENQQVYLTEDESSFDNAGYNYVPKLNLRKLTSGGTDTLVVSTMIGESETSYGLFEYDAGAGQTEATIPANSDYSFGTFKRIVTIGETSTIPSDKFYASIGFNGNINGTNATQRQFAQQKSTQPQYKAKWTVGTSPYSNEATVIPFIRVTSCKLLAQPNLQTIGFNSVMRMNKVIPAKIKQSDFLKSILTMYNLFVVVDKDQPNKLIFKSRDDFYDSGREVDWSKKLAKNKDQTITLLPDVANKKLILTYKQDDQDITLKGYKDAVKEIYGQYEYIFESEYVKGTETKELIFSPITVGKNSFGNLLPYINNIAPKNNIKIGLNAYQYESVTPITILNFSGVTSSGTSVSTSTIPLISHFDDIDFPTFDINFGVNDYYYYNSLQITNNNIYNLHWRRTISQINNGKMMSAYFNLTEKDIAELELNQKVYINNSWWNINKIIDYKAGKKELTKVELLSIDDELRFTPFAVKTPELPSNGDKLLNPIKDFTFNNETVTNQTIGNFPSSIFGKDNFIGDNSTKSLVIGDNNLINQQKSLVVGDNNQLYTKAIVFGDNNYVDPEITNVVIFGSDFSATTGDTVYLSNLEISSGGTINGKTINQIVDSIEYWSAGTASGSLTHNNNTGNVASGTYALAIGSATLASGIASHSQGQSTIASGSYSHAEGLSSVASGSTAHAEGNSTVAGGSYSHAEGFATTASGSSSHAEGQFSIANTDYSHAGGYYSKTKYSGQWARSTNSGASQYSIVDYSYTTTGNLPTEIFIGDTLNGLGGERLTLDNGEVIRYMVEAIAKDTATGDVKEWSGNGLIKNIGGTTTIVGSNLTSNFANAGIGLASMAITADDTNDSLKIEVTGITATTIKWFVYIRFINFNI